MVNILKNGNATAGDVVESLGDWVWRLALPAWKVESHRASIQREGQDRRTRGWRRRCEIQQPQRRDRIARTRVGWSQQSQQVKVW